MPADVLPARSRRFSSPSLPLQGGRTQLAKSFHKILDFVGEFRSLGRRNPPRTKPVLFDPTECQQLPQELHTPLCRVIAVHVVAITQMTSPHKHPVDTLLKGSQDVVRRHARRTHDANDPNVGRVLHTTDPSQVSSGVCSPSAEKTKHFGFKIAPAHLLSFLSRTEPSFWEKEPSLSCSSKPNKPPEQTNGRPPPLIPPPCESGREAVWA